jgi:hypothetical protein
MIAFYHTLCWDSMAYSSQGPVVGPYLHIVVIVTIYPLAHIVDYIFDYSGFELVNCRLLLFTHCEPSSE